MSAASINPFAQLLGLQPGRLPKSASTRVMVDGKPVTDLRQIKAAAAEDPERAAELCLAVKQARNSARYQAERADPQAMAARQARQDEAREARREYMRRYRAENRDRIRELQRNWQRAQYLQDPLASAAYRRDQYHANLEHERALARARYYRAKARRAAASKAANPSPTPERTTP